MLTHWGQLKRAAVVLLLARYALAVSDPYSPAACVYLTLRRCLSVRKSYPIAAVRSGGDVKLKRTKFKKKLVKTKIVIKT